MRHCGFAGLLLCCATVHAQDRADWQALAQLHPGDRVTIALKAHGSSAQRSLSQKNDGIFQSWTPDQINMDSATVRREDVQTVARYRKTGWGRGKSALLGAGIGGAIGAGVGIGLGGGDCGHSIGPCVSRGAGGAIVGGAGALLGAIIGALIPHHHAADIIYAARIQNATP